MASRSLNEGRDLNPGDTRMLGRRSSASGALNEGRDLNPGDTVDGCDGAGLIGPRSTKAGT